MAHDTANTARPDLEVLLAAVEASGEAILITSAELDPPGPRIEYANPAFTRMTGYAAHEVLGRSPRLLQGPGTERGVLDRMRAALAAGEPFQGEALNYRKDGSTYMVEWLITPVRNADGRITRWVSAQRDVTQRRASEDRQDLLVREAPPSREEHARHRSGRAQRQPTLLPEPGGVPAGLHGPHRLARQDARPDHRRSHAGRCFRGTPVGGGSRPTMSPGANAPR
ncbi:PAS domain-containing protein [Methylobacterium sp. P31]